jgi:RNA polymerase sigma factor (TIGR02999 family)
MMAGSDSNLSDTAAGPRGASELLPQVYEQLRALAQHRMNSEASGHSLQPTALVHEVYLKLAEGNDRFANRGHFFKVAADAMRQILIDHARSRGRVKRGGSAKKLPLSVLDLAALPEPQEILAFDDALDRLKQQAPMAAEVVRLRFYAGASVEEAAEALDVSTRTINREWTFARAWLFRVLSRDGQE